MTKSWMNKKSIDLFTTFLSFKTVEEVANFCRDLMTEAEIQEFASRWEVAQKLDLGLSQRQTSKETGVSIATVTRVNQWLKRGTNGYAAALKKLHQKPE